MWGQFFFLIFGFDLAMPSICLYGAGAILCSVGYSICLCAPIYHSPRDGLELLYYLLTVLFLLLPTAPVIDIETARGLLFRRLLGRCVVKRRIHEVCDDFSVNRTCFRLRCVCFWKGGNVVWDDIDRPECAVIYPVNEAIRNCGRRPSSLIRAERQRAGLG